jgi:DNA repair exonuclease SbcCD nuclease subunit
MKKTRLLKVGDPHAKISNLHELHSLFDWIRTTACEKEVDYIVIYGDMFDTHSVIRLEVLEAWYDIIRSIGTHTILMEGNHDQIGAREFEGQMSAVQSLGKMLSQDDIATVMYSPDVIDGIGFVPYTSNEEKFYGWAKDLQAIGAKTLCCHQTFQGSQFDSGMYAPDGFDPEKVPQSQIISGHIHKGQEFGKVWYIGTPRWESAVDAEQEKGVWIVDFEDGVMINREFLSTSSVVTPMRKIVLNEGDEEPVLLEGSKYLIEMVGSSSWLAKMRKKYLGLASIKSTCTDAKVRADRESKTFSSIGEFLDGDFKLSQGVEKQELLIYIGVA